MDSPDGSPGRFRNFKKCDFEADWLKMAEGRYGQVYRVKLKVGRGTYAVKSFEATDNFYRRKLDEASNSAIATSRHIVWVHGVCREANAVVMEYMSNGSLNNILSSHTLMWPKKFQMIHEASMGVNFLHGVRPPLLHLNLKTANILLDDRLHVKISDFDVVRWEEGGSKKEFMENLTARGNISYIPPETFALGPDPPGTEFDVYSFGIVIWEILTQQKPHAGCSKTTVILQVSHGKRPAVGIIPEQRPPACNEMMDIMTQCWNQDHRKRPQFSDIVRKMDVVSGSVKIGDSLQCDTDDDDDDDDDEGQKSDYPWLLSPVDKIALPEKPDLPSDERRDKGGVLSLLFTKNFGSFRHTVKREHICRQYSDQKRLLHFTVASGDAESVEHVLSLGAEVNCTTTKGYTPLIVAVLHRFHDIISLLLEHGASTSREDEEQWTALHFAAQNGDDRAVRLLLDKGADADAPEKAGWMPLHLACQNGHETVVRLLLSRLSEGALGQPEAQGRTPLHVASEYGHVNIAKLLLSQGADPNASDRSLSTALHLSAEKGHNRVVRQLLKGGGMVDRADNRGYSPLHLAALGGHTGICRQLLSKGAGPDSRTLQGWTPMHLAALKGHKDTVGQLESQGACVNALGDNGWTPLHLACLQSEPNVVEKLLSAKADPNISDDSKGSTPLHVACSSDSLPCVDHLITHHADVNAVNSGKATALHFAAHRGCAPIVKALVLNGANRTLQDSSGSTALRLAQRGKNMEVVKLLEEEEWSDGR